jgi:hypothetical protein
MIRGIREQFNGLHRAAIDACSIIYLLNTGVFESLAVVLSLVTTEDVFKETQWPRLPVEVKPSPLEARSNDHGLFLLAKAEGIPLISDDGEVLKMAKDSGMEYYNSLVMVNYLYFKGRITVEEYPLYRDRLLEKAHYSSRIIKRGEQIFTDLLVFSGNPD